MVENALIIYGVSHAVRFFIQTVNGILLSVFLFPVSLMIDTFSPHPRGGDGCIVYFFNRDRENILI